MDNSRADNGGKRAEWKVGYWYWPGWAGPNLREKTPIDMLYVHAGTYRREKPNNKQCPIRLHWPEKMPEAHTYVAVLRCEGPTCTDLALIPDLVKSFASLKRQAAKMGQKISGLQIDYDCPTIDLGSYARFLRELKRTLQKEDVLSITVLLDWFRPKTEVSDVISCVDEFVPQFYDVDYRKVAAADGGIAEPIDAARWAPVFNKHRKPYRVGIATFGRIVEKGRAMAMDESEALAIRGESPLHVSVHDKGTFVPYGTSVAGETIARFRGRDGDIVSSVKMIIPTQQSVSSAYSAAKALGGYCAGVLFFRYPLNDDALVLTPAEVSAMISGKPAMPQAMSMEAEDGLCATVSCSDLFVKPKDRFSPKETVLTIRSSRDLEYFVPNELMQGKMKGPRTIEVRVPAFASASRIPVGRAVSRDAVTFSVEEKP